MNRCLLPAAIVLFAAALRLWNVDLTPFLDDEASLLARGVELLQTGHIPLAGGTYSIGVREPPLMAFLLTPLLAISRRPDWIAACFTTADALAALLAYLTARRLAGHFAGCAAGLLYAVAPAAIYFTRRTDYYGLAPVCVALTLFLLVRASQLHSAVSLAAALLATAVAIQLHPLTAALLPVTLTVTAILWPRLSSYRPFAPALGLIGLSLAPYVYLQIRDGWSDLTNLVRFIREPKQQDWSGPQQALTLVGGGTYQQLLTERGAEVPSLALDVVGWLLVALAAAGIVLALVRGRSWLIPAALSVLTVLAGIRHVSGVLPYYMLPLLPPAAILAGVALAAVPVRFMALALLAAPLGWQLAGYARFQDTVAARGPELNYGMPLRYEIGAAGLLTEPPGSRLFVAQDGNQRASFPYLTQDRYRISHSDSRYGLPLAGGVYVVQGGRPAYDFLASHFGPPTTVVATTSGRAAFGRFRLPGNALERVEPELTPVQASVGAALQIRGYNAPDAKAGEPSPALLEWRVVDANAPLPSEVQQFMHLVDSQGETWSTNSDERAYPRSEWSTGDVVLSWFDLAPKLATPTGGYWLETGFYGYTGGEPVGPAVRLGPIRVQAARTTAPASLRAVFGGEIGLAPIERQGLDVRLTWSALRQPAADYTVFVHLLDATGEVLAQHDGPPQDGAFPTSLWRAGDVVTDVHHLAGQAGGSRIEIGLYRRPSLERLPATTPEGTALGDHLELPA